MGFFHPPPGIRMITLWDRGEQGADWWQGVPTAYEALRAHDSWIEDGLIIDGDIVDEPQLYDRFAQVLWGAAKARQSDVAVVYRSTKPQEDAP